MEWSAGAVQGRMLACCAQLSPRTCLRRRALPRDVACDVAGPAVQLVQPDRRVLKEGPLIKECEIPVSRSESSLAEHHAPVLFDARVRLSKRQIWAGALLASMNPHNC